MLVCVVLPPSECGTRIRKQHGMRVQLTAFSKSSHTVSKSESYSEQLMLDAYSSYSELKWCTNSRCSIYAAS